MELPVLSSRFDVIAQINGLAIPHWSAMPIVASVRKRIAKLLQKSGLPEVLQIC